jgi:hypothetical protein
MSKFFSGFGIYYSLNNKIKLINFDIISKEKKQDAKCVIRGFRFLREQPFFKQIEHFLPNTSDGAIENKELIIWMDCGKTFRNCEVLGYFFKELKKEKVNGKNCFDYFNIENIS